jgi:SprT-like family
MSHMLDDYCSAAVLLFGEPVSWLYDEFQRHNAHYFGGALQPIPIVVGLSAYGGCLGLTRLAGEWGDAPRITIATQYLKRGRNETSDILLHEMIHALLSQQGENVRHNGAPWCREIMRITPLLDLPPILAAPIVPSRVPSRAGGLIGRQAKPVRVAKPSHLSRQDLAHWPHSLRSRTASSSPPLRVSMY